MGCLWPGSVQGDPTDDPELWSAIGSRWPMVWHSDRVASLGSGVIYQRFQRLEPGPSLPLDRQPYTAFGLQVAVVLLRAARWRSLRLVWGWKDNTARWLGIFRYQIS